MKLEEKIERVCSVKNKNRLLKAVNRYLVVEFGVDSEIKEVPKDGIVHLAYTTYDFDDGEEHEVQVDFDLINLKYLNYIDNELVLEEERDTEESFISEIEVCDFNDIIRECVHKGFELYEK